jgi:hypothetical protein
MKNFIKKILFGNTPVSEYVTVTIPGDIVEKVFLQTHVETIDISARHWLLCLDPVIFGIWFSKDEKLISPSPAKSYIIRFTDSAENNKTVAKLKLDLFDVVEDEHGTLLLLKLISIKSYHINFIRTRLLYQQFYKKPGQDFNKLISYAGAYSYPRKVRIISFAEGEYYNIFPMDLVGDVPGCNRFVFGLRHTNVTLARIIETKKIVASEVSYKYKGIIYQLGKHHSGPPLTSSLGFKTMQTDLFRFPVPEWVSSYKEIKIIRTMDIGSHMLLFGEEVNEKILTTGKDNLFHIHFLHYLHQKNKVSGYQKI